MHGQQNIKIIQNFFFYYFITSNQVQWHSTHNGGWTQAEPDGHNNKQNIMLPDNLMYSLS